VSRVLASAFFAAALVALEAWPGGTAAWSGLNPGDQAVLRPVEGQWDTLPAETRTRLLRIARRYHDWPPEQQTRVRQRLALWAQLTPEQRDQARRNFENLQRLPPEQRERIRKHWLEHASPLEDPSSP